MYGPSFAHGTPKISKDNQIHIANQTNMDVRVIVVPNKDFIIADVVASVATTIGFAIATGGASLGEVPEQIKTFSDLMKLLKLLKTLASMMGIEYKAAQAAELLDKTTVTIAPGEVKNVLTKALYNPLDYLGPSGWARISTGKDVTIGIFLWDKTSRKILETTEFNSNSDVSWLVDSVGVHQVVYGKLWVMDPRGATHCWNN